MITTCLFRCFVYLCSNRMRSQMNATSLDCIAQVAENMQRPGHLNSERQLALWRCNANSPSPHSFEQPATPFVHRATRRAMCVQGNGAPLAPGHLAPLQHGGQQIGLHQAQSIGLHQVMNGQCALSLSFCSLFICNCSFALRDCGIRSASVTSVPVCQHD